MIEKLGECDPAAEVGEVDEVGRFFPLQNIRTREDPVGPAVLLDCFVVMA